MLSQILLYLHPVILVVANPLAVRADRQQSAQSLDVRQRFLQFVDPGRERLLESDDPGADAQARPQFVPAERLGDVVVGAAFQTGDNVLLLLIARQDDQIHRRQQGRVSDLTTEIDAVYARHVPVDDGDRWGIRLL